MHHLYILEGVFYIHPVDTITVSARQSVCHAFGRFRCVGCGAHSSSSQLLRSSNQLQADWSTDNMNINATAATAAAATGLPTLTSGHVWRR